jgi:hypothetical protein
MQDESTPIHREHVSVRSVPPGGGGAAIGAGDGEIFRTPWMARAGLPSFLMARLKNQRVTAAAKILDRKLSAPAEMATGAAA